MTRLSCSSVRSSASIEYGVLHKRRAVSMFGRRQNGREVQVDNFESDSRQKELFLKMDDD